MAENGTKFSWGQVATALFLLILGGGFGAVLDSHGDAIEMNREAIRINERTTAVLSEDVRHIKETSLTLAEQKDLCVTLADLRSAVNQLQTQVERLEEITR